VRAGDRRECDGPARFLVRYTRPDDGRVLDEHRACFLHGVAEVDRHRAANGASDADLVEVDPPAFVERILGSTS
jgi:hypothetical protein